MFLLFGRPLIRVHRATSAVWISTNYLSNVSNNKQFRLGSTERKLNQSLDFSTNSQGNHIYQTKSENADAPNVLLLGWGGCQYHYLAKYSNIYLNQGCSVAQYIAPLKIIRPFSFHPIFAREFYEQTLNNDETSPIIFHVFSMNGCTLFLALWNLLDTVPNGDQIKKRVKGIIFDSAPADVSPKAGAEAISISIFPPPHHSEFACSLYKVGSTASFAFRRATVWLQSLFDPTAFETNYAYYRMFKVMDLPKHQLYLYSNRDDVCPDHSIEDFLKLQQRRGMKVQSKCWESSAHVQHFRAHPEEYTQLCEKFLVDALNFRVSTRQLPSFSCNVIA